MGWMDGEGFCHHGSDGDRPWGQPRAALGSGGCSCRVWGLQHFETWTWKLTWDAPAAHPVGARGEGAELPQPQRENPPCWEGFLVGTRPSRRSRESLPRTGQKLGTAPGTEPPPRRTWEKPPGGPSEALLGIPQAPAPVSPNPSCPGQGSSPGGCGEALTPHRNHERASSCVRQSPVIFGWEDPMATSAFCNCACYSWAAFPPPVGSSRGISVGI